MTGPAKSGVIVYSHHIQSLAQFYIAFFDMRVTYESDELLYLESSGLNLVIHQPPIELYEPFFNRVKIFFTVNSLIEARSRVKELGGRVLEGVWSNEVFSLCNVADPEGNHIQLREFTSK